MKKIHVFSGFLATVFLTGLLMTMYLNHRNGKKMQHMGKNKQVFEKFFSDLEAHTRCKVLITSGYRDTKKQQELYEQNSKNAPPGKSRHEKKKAMDINLICFDGILKKATSQKKWKAKGVHLVAKKHNLIWGGGFQELL